MPESDEKQLIEQVVIIAGPTASGKTEVGIELARLISGEIISADSRQFYLGMDIGTAKPTLREQQEVPHHLIDIRPPDQFVTAGEFRQLALDVIKQIFQKRKIPILVGGSGLYIKALLHGIFPESRTDQKLRQRLYQEAREKGNTYLYNRLLSIDPEYGIKIHINDLKRITRALEVYYLTGKPLSEHFKNQKTEFLYPYTVFLLTLPRADLYERINRRVEMMFQQGLVKEVKDLLAAGYRQALEQLNTLGYQEVIQYLEGRVSYPEMVEQMKRNTRRYAKRQLTWFKNQEHCIEIIRQPDESPEIVARRMLDLITRQLPQTSRDNSPRRDLEENKRIQ